MVELEASREDGAPDHPPLGVLGTRGEPCGDGHRESLAGVVEIVQGCEAGGVEPFGRAFEQRSEQLIDVVVVVANGIRRELELGGDVGQPEQGLIVTLHQSARGGQDVGPALRLGAGARHSRPPVRSGSNACSCFDPTDTTKGLERAAAVRRALSPQDAYCSGVWTT